MDFNEDTAISQSTPDSQMFIETSNEGEEDKERVDGSGCSTPSQNEPAGVEADNNQDLYQIEETLSQPIFSPTTKEDIQQDSNFPSSSTTDFQENIISSTEDVRESTFSPTEDVRQENMFSPTTTQHSDLIMSPTDEESRYDNVVASSNNDENNAEFSPVDSGRQGAISALDDRHDYLVSPTDETEEQGRDIVSPTEERQQSAVSPTEEQQDDSTTEGRHLIFSPKNMEEQQSAITPTEKGFQEVETTSQEQNIDPFTIELSNESHAEELVVNSNGYNDGNNNENIEDSEQVTSFHVKQAWNDDGETREENKEQMMVVDATYTTDACSPDGKFTVGQYSSTFGDNDELSGSSSDEQESPNHHVVMSSVKPNTFVGTDLQQQENSNVNGEEDVTRIVGYENEQIVVGGDEESNVYF